MDRKTIVEIKGLVKRFDERTVVDDLYLEVYKGECFGILGPNNSGKSSTMRMLYGSSSIDGGEAYILGLNVKTSVREIKSRIGVIPQDDGLDVSFTVRENIQLYSGYHGLDPHVAQARTDDLLKLMRLEESADRLVSALTPEMRRRLAIARGMINHPELLILDEPTVGLDLQARTWIWRFLEKIKSEMGTVILTTHYMEEAEKICDRIAVISKGRILAVGEPKQLIKDLVGTQVLEFEVKLEDLNYYLGRMNSNGFRYQTVGNQVNVHIQENESSQVAMGLISGVKSILRYPNLNDVFLKLAGHDLRDEPL